jgi:hypothetical protein
MKTSLTLLLVAAGCLFLSSCSNFGSRFARGVKAAPGDRISGTYEGRWESTSHPGGGGKLFCILQRQSGTAYHADFKATWHGIFFSEHQVVLNTRPARSGTGARTFTGSAALSTFIGSGTYRCEGVVDGKRMRACYEALNDRGTFSLARVAPAAPVPAR